jgi:signal peptidase I
MAELEKAAVKWLKPYPHASYRENVEVFLVAIAVAMGIRTFFLQPFKIPTGSMQPTLYGITHENLKNRPDVAIPTGWRNFKESWFNGNSYYHVVAENSGELNTIREMQRFLLFNLRQTFNIGSQTYTVWFPPDQLFTGLARAGVREGQTFQKGEDVIRLRVKSGDHLFVDRMTYNFRRPTRGEIIVFETRGIEALPQDQFYIKRLVALGDEKVRLGDDHRLIINEVPLNAATRRFESVYTFDPERPREGEYFGHVNDTVALKFNRMGLSPRFPDEKTVFPVRHNHYLTMGDNTMNSYDSRGWGDFSRNNVIGKSAFVYWPISTRFGWGYR